MTEVAGARAVRDEDAFDVAAVATWLRTHADGWGADEVPEVRQFSGGASNLTYLLRHPADGDGSGRDLILRRPPSGQKAKGAHDMGREFRIQSALAPVFPLVPRMAQRVLDRAIQVFGGAGVSQDTPLAHFFAHARTLRLADGPDEVHLMSLARQEFGRYLGDP